MAEKKTFSKQLIGKKIVSKTGKIFRTVGDVIFEIRTGELIYLVLKDPTPYTKGLDLEKGKAGDFLVPFSSVMAVGDMVVVAEEDIV